jgi:hypothetical protein
MGGGNGQSWSSMGGSHGELAGEGKEGEGEEEVGGAAWGRHGELLGEWEGAPWGLRAARSCVAVLLVVSAVREKKKRTWKEKGEEKEKEGKEKEKKGKKYGKNFKLENFRKIKDNL